MDQNDDRASARARGAESHSERFSLYVHIPFCRRKCLYCDFNSYAGLEDLIEAYICALKTEIRLSSSKAEVEGLFAASNVQYSPMVGTIYFGGGTPTLLSPNQIDQIVGVCREVFDVASDAEISAEANPGTVDSSYLFDLRAAGVNRLSLGVQSFDDGILRTLGRLHSSSGALEAYQGARRAGFDIVSLDLIYALPSQDLFHWDDTLCQLLDLRPEHVSLYGLTVEEGTPLYNLVRIGRLSLPDEDLSAEMYLLAQDRLARSGYAQYEISNWARTRSDDPPSEVGIPHLACRHNLTYWQYRPYLGFGAGAHSFANGRRWWNVLQPQDYIGAISAGGGATKEVEDLSEAGQLADAIILGLRLNAGLDYDAFRARFGVDLRSIYEETIADLAEADLVESDSALRLTQRGRLLGNEVFARFLPKTSPSPHTESGALTLEPNNATASGLETQKCG